ncbi:hypothetical protein GUJ93_ZPchr0006g46408 [Zizania palustris]|uniref:Rx N-terminal domain-containing protein n=1 Tax=Zizania palustris TaxID=103762 RepID=A0A8J5TC11_ZIZPA|nr:hypothetical protein GUJ93_ZPchr0006g46408 [Zizania palustris]
MAFIDAQGVYLALLFSPAFSIHCSCLLQPFKPTILLHICLYHQLCTALNTADKLVSCANKDAEQLLEKVEKLERVLERGDDAVAAIVERLEHSRLFEDSQLSKLQSSGLDSGFRVFDPKITRNEILKYD